LIVGCVLFLFHNLQHLHTNNFPSPSDFSSSFFLTTALRQATDFFSFSFVLSVLYCVQPPGLCSSRLSVVNLISVDIISQFTFSSLLPSVLICSTTNLRKATDLFPVLSCYRAHISSTFFYSFFHNLQHLHTNNFPSPSDSSSTFFRTTALRQATDLFPFLSYHRAHISSTFFCSFFYNLQHLHTNNFPSPSDSSSTFFRTTALRQATDLFPFLSCHRAHISSTYCFCATWSNSSIMASPAPRTPATSALPTSPTASSPRSRETFRSKIPVRVNSKRVAVPELKAALERAVRARGTRYSNILAFSVYWDDDNTLAKEDSQTFIAMMRDMFDVSCQTFVLQSKSPIPAWDLNLQLIEAIKAKLKNQKPSLLVFSYAGHGVINNLDELSFASRNNKKLVPWSTVQSELTPPELAMDLFAILDCCHSGSAVTGSPNSIHVLAACGAPVWARSRTNSISFTQRVARAIRPIFNSGKVSISTEEIFHAVQKETPAGAYMSRFSSHSGANPIILPFKVAATSGSGISSSGASSSDLRSSPRPSLPSSLPLRPHNRETHVLVMLTLEGKAAEVTRDFQKVIETMPAKFQMKMTDAFETNASAGVFVRMTWEAFARLLSTVNMEPLLPIIGPSLVGAQLREVPTIPVGENLPFRERPQRKG
jgi:hypothetical protein